MNKFLCLLLTLIILSSCTNNNSKNYTITEENGIKVFNNKNIPSDNKFKISVNKLFSIDGTEFKDSLKYFQSAAAFDVDNNGNIFIVDKQSSTILKFDKKGKFLSRFGGKGNGPGEFISYGGKGNLTIFNNNLYLLYYPQDNIIKYNLNGDFLNSENRKRKTMPSTLQQYTKKKFIGYTNKYVISNGSVVLNKVMGILDDSFNIVHKFSEHKSNPRITAKPTNPFKSDRFHTFNKNRIFIANNSEDIYSIDVLDSNFNYLYKIRKNYTKIDFSKEDLVLSGVNKKDRKIVKYRLSIGNLFIDKNKILWVATPKTKSEKNIKGLKFDLFKDGVFLNTIFLNLPVDEFWLYTDIKIIKDKIYILDSKNSSIVVYKY